MQEHSKLKALWGWNPAQLQPIDTISVSTALAPSVAPASPEMPARMRGSSDPKFNEESMYLLMDEHITKTQLKETRANGCLFHSKGNTLSFHINYWEDLLAASISECRQAFFRKFVVQAALERLNDRLPDDQQIDGEVPLRLQAANFCRYTTELRSVKRT